MRCGAGSIVRLLWHGGRCAVEERLIEVDGCDGWGEIGGLVVDVGATGGMGGFVVVVGGTGGMGGLVVVVGGTGGMGGLVVDVDGTGGMGGLVVDVGGTGGMERCRSCPCWGSGKRGSVQCLARLRRCLVRKARASLGSLGWQRTICC